MVSILFCLLHMQYILFSILRCHQWHIPFYFKCDWFCKIRESSACVEITFIQTNTSISLSKICIFVLIYGQIQGNRVVLWTEWHVICVIKMIKIHANYCRRMVHHQSNSDYKLFWAIYIYSISLFSSINHTYTPRREGAPTRHTLNSTNRDLIRSYLYECSTHIPS